MIMNIIETNLNNITSIDIYSKLLQSNIIFINDIITAETVSMYQAQLLYLENSNNKTINIYINSPGGDVYSLLGLYDLIQVLKNKGIIIRTINVGLCASAAAVILLSGSEGYRESLPNCRVMLHQPSSGTYGTVSDMEIDLKESVELKEVLNNIISNHTGLNLRHQMERDYWMSAKEAKDFNIIDKII